MLLIVPAVGCVQFTDLDTSSYAVEFNGESSCIEAPTDVSILSDPEAGFTIEAWVQGPEEAAFATHPLIIWNGAFALWTGAEGEGHFTDSSTSLQGADGSAGWMDGGLHHVAGTYQSGTASLFLDGEKIAFNGSSALGGSPAESIYIGCWASTDVHFEGIIDEVRLSSSVRYTENFSPIQSEFELDDATIHLWHFDEGENDIAKDEAARADAYLTHVDWVNFSLSGDDTAVR
jgi:hypothetical protein